MTKLLIDGPKDTYLLKFTNDLYSFYSSYSQVSNRRSPGLLIFRKFSTQDIFIPHPLLLNFGKCSSQDIFKLDSNKKPFQYFC